MGKINDVKEYIEARLLKAGIIDNELNILDKKAFVEFINLRRKELESQLKECEKDGVVIDQYKYNLLNTEWIYLGNMEKHMTVDPDLMRMDDIEDAADKKIKEEEEKKQKKFNNGTKKVAKKFNFFGLSRLFGRNK